MILGIETSCDDTSAAVLDKQGQVLSSLAYNQDRFHQKFGGIVPELASREHLNSITQVVHEALHEAKISLKDLTAIAVTHGPGLIGSLLVGVHFAKALGAALNIPVYPVHHHMAHVMAGLFQESDVKFPVLALIVSGGHTHLYLMKSAFTFELMGATLDDAAGEAFDKSSQVLGLGFSGGPAIEQAAKSGKVQSKLLPKPKVQKFDYSFSGLKTALAYLVRDLAPITNQQRFDIAATFQFRVIESLLEKLKSAQEHSQAVTLLLCGGVSRNQYLRDQTLALCKELQVDCLIPEYYLCTDNAAMVAASAWMQIRQNKKAPMNFETFSNRPLEEYIS